MEEDCHVDNDLLVLAGVEGTLDTGTFSQVEMLVYEMAP